VRLPASWYKDSGNEVIVALRIVDHYIGRGLNVLTNRVTEPSIESIASFGFRAIHSRSGEPGRSPALAHRVAQSRERAGHGLDSSTLRKSLRRSVAAPLAAGYARVSRGPYSVVEVPPNVSCVPGRTVRKQSPSSQSFYAAAR